jgi:heme exporter protein C
MKMRLAGTALAAALVVFAGYAALFMAPTDVKQGDVYRIMFFHIASWTAMFCALSICFAGNIAWLTTHRLKWDWLGVSAAEVGVACCTAGLVTGPLWARPIWGIWWTWDARLTTTFILWLLYISYLMLRGLIEEPERRATLSAVFGVFAFLDVPLVYMSNRLWRTQHPQPVLFGGEGSGLDPVMLRVLLLSMVAILGVMALALASRYRLERLRSELDELRMAVEAEPTDSSTVVTRGAK